MQIAADRRGVAQLRRCARQQRFGNRWIGPGEIRIMREVGVAHERTDAQQPSERRSIRSRPGKPREVDEAVRPRDSAFHQVEKVGAAREIGGTRRGAQLQPLRKSSRA